MGASLGKINGVWEMITCRKTKLFTSCQIPAELWAAKVELSAMLGSWCFLEKALWGIEMLNV